jgi:tetratricopeptide (TPR) repeat protein
LPYHYGALLIRLEEFAAAAHYLTQAREYLYRLEVKTLLRGNWQAHHHFRFHRGMVDLERAYLALRQRAYPQALAQAAHLLTVNLQGGNPLQLRRLRASAHLVMARAYYEQRQYREAHAQATQAMTLDPALEERETFYVLTQTRLLCAAGKDEEALATGIAGCKRLLRRLGIDCPEKVSWSAQLSTFVYAVCLARNNTGVWTRIMPDEREEIGNFLVVLGAIQRAHGQMTQALRLLLLAGSLLPQADEIDIPEFEYLARDLGERALREPLAFATLEALLTHPVVLGRWEFLEAILEALGRIDIGPALASVSTLKANLPRNLPLDTRKLIGAIQADLEHTLKTGGKTAEALGLRVCSNTRVRFVVKAPFKIAKLGVFLDLIEAIVRRWQLTDIGMADPEPSTPETEYLTDVLEEGMTRLFARPEERGVGDTGDGILCRGEQVG